MAVVGSHSSFCSKNRLNALVIDEVTRMVHGPNPTEDDYNSIAAALGQSIHDDIARLADDIAAEADRIGDRRGF